MTRPAIDLRATPPLVVGSFGDLRSLSQIPLDEIRESCDLVEIRLDLLAADSSPSEPAPWQRFEDIPLLFTARRRSEGGAGDLSADQRTELLRCVIDDASLIDIEVASISEMHPLIDELRRRDIPWVASYHNFKEVPENSLLSTKRMLARHSGAAAFKAAVELGWDNSQLTPLSLFLQQSNGYPVSLMGMGPLAPVSRVLFAQLGSVLNYGYLGETPTAPGQWSARQLKRAIQAVDKA